MHYLGLDFGFVLLISVVSCSQSSIIMPSLAIKGELQPLDWDALCYVHCSLLLVSALFFQKSEGTSRSKPYAQQFTLAFVEDL